MFPARRIRIGVLLSVGAALVGVTGCSPAAAPQPAASASAPVLPYGIPLPGDSRVVEAVTPTTPIADVTGWSAAATTATAASEVVSDYTRWAADHGWTTTRATIGATTTVTARRSASGGAAAAQAAPRPESGIWLQISVTSAGQDIGTFIGIRAADVPR